MRKAIVAAAIVILSLAVTLPAHAGSLNQYEADIVAAAKKTYEYDGVLYKVDQSYINQLIDYLSSDGVDLTAEQRDEVIQSAYSSLETGVMEGYLQPTTEQPAATPTPPAEAGDPVDTATAPEETVGGDTASGQGQDGPSSDAVVGEDNTPSGDSTGQITGSDPTVDKTVVSPEEQIKDILKEQAVTPTPTVSAGQESSIFDSFNDKDKEESSVIKDTGFDFTDTFIVIIGMGVLMMIGIYVTFRSDLFAHEDE